jgi:hypothetical protein
MDVALAIFNIGAGLGVLAAGGALVYLAWQTTPLIKESRALTGDLRRLTRTADAELRPILAHTRELTSNVEVLSEDVAVKLDRLTDLMNALQQGLERGQITVAAGPTAMEAPSEPERWTSEPEPRWEPEPERMAPEPVESWETREGSSDS